MGRNQGPAEKQRHELEPLPVIFESESLVKSVQLEKAHKCCLLLRDLLPFAHWVVNPTLTHPPSPAMVLLRAFAPHLPSSSNPHHQLLAPHSAQTLGPLIPTTTLLPSDLGLTDLLRLFPQL